MTHHASVRSLLALSFFALVSCSDEPTQPSSGADQLPGAPQLAVTSNTWITRRNIATYVADVSTATVTNAGGQSIVYAIGGSTDAGTCLGRTRAYNVTTNSWAKKAYVPAALCGMNGAGVINGKIYITGGVGPHSYSRTPRSSLFVYSPTTNTWTQKRNMPVGGSGGVTGVMQGKLYVVTTKNDTAHFFRYNPSTDSWTRLAAPTNYHWLGGGGGVINGKLYLIAQATKVYDPATNQWTTLGPLPGDLHGSSVVLRAQLYIFGADTRTGAEQWGIFAYDPASNTWKTKPLLTTLQDSYNIHAATRVFLNGQSRVELIGGYPLGCGFTLCKAGNNLQYIP
jgi:N-acetylneuraminic acid mutarotase